MEVILFLFRMCICLGLMELDKGDYKGLDETPQKEAKKVEISIPMP